MNWPKQSMLKVIIKVLVYFFISFAVRVHGVTKLESTIIEQAHNFANPLQIANMKVVMIRKDC
jgi:hypothetical protein